jgi:hypothetical protein
MIKIAADFNYYQFRNIDLLNSNKIFIDNIYAELKYELSPDVEKEKNFEERQSLITLIGQQKKTQEKNIFFQIVKSKDYKETDDIANLNSYHMDSVLIYDNIKDKIKMDNILTPLKIFWIRSDYDLLNKIITLILTGLSFFANSLMNDVKEIFNSYNIQLNK